MVFILSAGVIFVTHLLLKENKIILEKSLAQLLFITVAVIIFSAVISTWLGTLIPTILITLITATILQIRYSTQIEKDRPF